VKFSKYPSITNHYMTDDINYVKSKMPENTVFVVQEKAHGANLSFWCNKDEVLVAKRTGFLLESDNFFPKQINDLMIRFKSKIIKVYNDLQKQMSEEIEEFVIYGELIGGSFKNKQDKDSIRVQKGVEYCPFNEFYGFDIRVNDTYLGQVRCEAIFEEIDMLYAKTLFKGSLDACINFDTKFNSIIPKQLGLDSIINNTIEGTVIKPYFDALTNKRFVVKKKNDEFKEKSSKKRRPQKAEELNPEASACFDEMSKYVTMNRLNNVISKIGQVDRSHFGQLAVDLKNDVLEEFGTLTANKDDNKKILKMLSKLVSKTINDYFNNRSQ